MTRRTTAPAVSPQAPGDKNDGLGNLIARYACGPVGFTGTDDALYEKRLVFDHVAGLGNGRLGRLAACFTIWGATPCRIGE